MPCMANNKKRPGGKHVSPRKTVQMPEDWLRVAEEMASEVPTPLTWFLVSLIQERAEARKKAGLPPLPWKLPPKP